MSPYLECTWHICGMNKKEESNLGTYLVYDQTERREAKVASKAQTEENQ